MVWCKETFSKNQQQNDWLYDYYQNKNYLRLEFSTQEGCIVLIALFSNRVYIFFQYFFDIAALVYKFYLHLYSLNQPLPLGVVCWYITINCSDNYITYWKSVRFYFCSLKPPIFISANRIKQYAHANGVGYSYSFAWVLGGTLGAGKFSSTLFLCT